jgi:hypothetical protein
MLKENSYVTHIMVPELPKDEFNQLFFYTVTDKSLRNGKFYWGKGNVPYSKEYIDNFLAKKEIQKLNTKEYPFLLKDDESLGVDEKGIIYSASLNFPTINQNKICTLEGLAKK